MKAILLTSAVLFFVSFDIIMSKNDTLLEPADYDKFLTVDNEKEVLKAQNEFDFWNNKWIQAPNQYTYLIKMASRQNALFTYTGNIDHLSQATRFLEEANRLSYSESPSILRELAKNYISEHRFIKAQHCLDVALAKGYQLQATYKMLFDVHLELGNAKKAYSYLDQVKDKNSFDFMIRQAKWQDHNGELNEAIFSMQLALLAAEENERSDLIQWTVTNLADFYGHKGDIKKSYKHYIRALELDPIDAYAKKGLVWIAFSYEKDVDEAIRILDKINTYHNMPDYLLLRSEIAEYAGDEMSKEKYLDNYFTEIKALGEKAHMYNKYSALQYAEDNETRGLAKAIAEKEIKLRPTSQSYSLLAYVYLKDGDIDNALAIVNDKILGHTYEPEPLLIAAMVLKTTEIDFDYNEQYRNLKSELLGSVYELGPIQEKIIMEF